jgi:hypothetical protein
MTPASRLSGLWPIICYRVRSKCRRSRSATGGSLQPARRQARIPSLADAELLIRLVRELGWGDRHADDALGQVQ